MSAPPILLLPGLLCDAAVWRDQVAGLAPAACVVPDYGMADSITAMAQQVLAGMAAPRFSVAGHSMGGRVALEILRLAPERVIRLALLDTGVEPLAAGAAGAAEVAKREALLGLALTAGMRAMGEQWARGMVHPGQLGQPVFDDILRMIERKTPEVFAAQVQALLHRPDASAVLAAAACPVWLLCGRQDAWSPLARHEAMQVLRPDATLVVIEESGHMTTMEQPHAVTEALQGWMTH